jgi:hypothetical protein
MSKVNVDLILNTADSAKSLKDVKTSIKELKDAAIQFGESSEEFSKLTQKAGELTDKIGDVNQRIKTLSSDTQKIQGAIGVVQGLAGAFGAVQGAAALFGANSEKLQETMVKLQATMTLLNSLQQVANVLNKDSAASIFLKTTATKAYNLVVGASTGALKLFRLALAATGIGAIAVGIGLLVANWDKLTKAVSENSEQFQNFKKVLMFVLPPVYAIIKGVELIKEKFGGFTQLLGGIVESVKQFASNIGDVFSALFSGDIDGVIAAAKNIGKGVGTAFNNGVKQTQAEIDEEIRIERVKAEIKAQEDILKVKKAKGEDTVALEREILQKKLSILKKGTDEYIAAEVELYAFETEQNKERKKKADEYAHFETEQNKERKKKADEYAQKQRELQKQLIDSKLRLLEDGQAKEIAVEQENLKVKLAAIKGNGKVENELRESLKNESLQKISAIEKSYEEKRRTEQLARLQNELNENELNGQLIGEKGKEISIRIENEKWELVKQSLKEGTAEYEAAFLKHKENLKNIDKEYTNESIQRLDNELKEKELKGILKGEEGKKIEKRIEEEKWNLRKLTLIEGSAEYEAEFLKFQEKLLDIDEKYKGKVKEKVDWVSVGLQATAMATKAAFDIINQQMNATFDKQMANVEATKNSQLAALNAEKEARNVNFENMSAEERQKFEQEQEYNQKRAAIERQAAEEKRKLQIEQFKRQKKAALIEAVINTALSIASANRLVPPANIPAMILAGIAGAAQIATIASQPMPAFKKGGMVKGAGTGTSDSITAKLSNGESVINAKSTSMFAPILSRINQAGGGVPIVPRFAKGGVATDTQQMDFSKIEGMLNQQPVIKTYVVESEMSASQKRIKTIEDRAKF